MFDMGVEALTEAELASFARQNVVVRVVDARFNQAPIDFKAPASQGDARTSTHLSELEQMLGFC